MYLQGFRKTLQDLWQSDVSEHKSDTDIINKELTKAIQDILITELEPLEVEFEEHLDSTRLSFEQDNREIYEISQKIFEETQTIEKQLLTESKEQLDYCYDILLLEQALFIFDKINGYDKKPFKEEYNKLNSLSKQVPVLNNYIEQLPHNSYINGMKSYTELQNEFDEIRNSANQEQNRFYSQVIKRPEGLEAGDDLQTQLSRASYYISRRSLSHALEEFSKMPFTIQVQFKDWIISAEQRIQLERAQTNLSEYIRQLLATTNKK